MFAAAVAALAVFGFAFRVRMGAAAISGHLPFLVGAAGAVIAYFACRSGRAEALFLLRWPALVASLGVLGAMAALGRVYRGGVFVAGGLNPTEIVKPLFALFASATLARGIDRSGRVDARAVAELALGFAPLALGIVLLRDFGLLALVSLALVATLLAASWRWGLVAVAATAGAIAFVLAHPFGHLVRRVALWRDPFADPTGSGWQTLHSLAAMTAGGWTGEGFGRGAVDAIPIASSDFVYAAVAEEFGMIGSIALVAGYCVVLWRGLAIARRAGTEFRALLAIALVSTVALQAIVNIGGVVNAIPMTGVTLPLISHGGSSLMVTLVSLGVLAAL